MMAILAVLLCVAAPISIEGLRVIPPAGVAGVPSINAVRADLGGDAGAVLLFEQGIARAPYADRPLLPYPVVADALRFDTWRGMLYVLSPRSLSAFRLEADGWIAGKQWPVDCAPLAALTPPDAPTHEFFLYSVDGDAIPEIIWADVQGLWIIGLDDDGAYRATEPVGQWPPPAQEPARDQHVWPPESRHLLSPARQGRYRVLLDGDAAIVLTRDPLPSGQARYTSSVWSGNKATPWSAVRFPPVPEFVQPCRLNPGTAIHFAGSHWTEAASSVLPVPILETWASLDGGETFSVRRSRALQRGGTRVSFVDIDGDGDQDWVTDEPDIFDRGARDALSQYLSSTKLRLRIEVYRQDAGEFESTPGMDIAVAIDFDAPPARSSAQRSRYTAGSLYQVSGDLNGDGARDLSVRSAPDAISIYLSTDGAFPQNPDTVLEIAPELESTWVDINGDGKDDWLRWDPARPMPAATVVFAPEFLR